MTTLLEVHPWRWTFRALERIHFGHAGNTLRGALGYALADSPEYANWFRPSATAGPSGLADPPRPFVLRAAHLDDCGIAAGEEFAFDLFSFETRVDRFDLVREALRQAAGQGIGAGRGRAELLPGDAASPIRVPLEPHTDACRVRVHYLTPTELKGGHADEFATLLARVRDRVATIRGLYGSGQLDVDFRRLGERALQVRTIASQLATEHQSKRTSTRTGHTHGLGGVTGYVDFEGELQEFLPWLEAAQWTGVGRQTVWGKGAIRTEPLP